ncbi:MAG: reverse transcriptase N-terminal domain-containing protein [bacterium]
MAEIAGALKDEAERWNSIVWKKAQREVRRLQVRIAKAVILQGSQSGNAYNISFLSFPPLLPQG